MPRCRACAATIDFIRTKAGKLCPVESAETDEYRVWITLPADKPPGVTFRPLVLVTPEGETWRVFQGFYDQADRKLPVAGPCTIVGSESHFAHCPDASAFRRA